MTLRSFGFLLSCVFQYGCRLFRRGDELGDDAVVVEDLDEVDDLLLLGFFFGLFLGFFFGLFDLFIAGLVGRPVRASGDGATLGGTAALA